MSNQEKDQFANNFNFKKQLGQNFLIDEKVIERICNTIRSFLLPSTKVLEIGPGAGAITKNIATTNSVIALELDQEVVNYLKKLKIANLQIQHCDALEVDWTNIISFNDLIFSNTPYCISTALITKVIKTNLSCKVIFLVQKEVYEKIAAEINTKHYSAYSVFCQTFLTINNFFDVSNKAFMPEPKVTSTLCSLEKKEVSNIDIDHYWRFLTICFSMRRKTLYNNLKQIHNDLIIEKIFSDLNLQKTVRAQELTLEQFQLAFKIYEANN